MNNEHTPGPWKTDGVSVQVEYGKTNYRNFVCANNEQRETFSAMIDGKDSETSRANARLIAAAPELLEVCKELKEVLSKGVFYGRDMEAEYQAWGKCCNVVAKAEGK